MRKGFLCNPLIAASLFSLALTPPVYASEVGHTEEVFETSPVITVGSGMSRHNSSETSSSSEAETSEQTLETSPVITVGSGMSQATPSNASLSLSLSLEEIDSRRLNALEKSNSLKEEILSLSSFIEQTNICSEANRAFNQLSEKYNEYLVENYSAVLYSSLYKIEGKQNGTMEDDIKNLDIDKENIKSLLSKAEAKANALFDNDYELMCKIVNAEVGACTDKEQFYECNMLENRKKHPAFPNTLYAVVYQRGQFPPARNGRINKPVIPRARKNVEFFLRGNVETGMPDNVVYQSGVPQGSGTWQITEHGVHFCYY